MNRTNRTVAAIAASFWIAALAGLLAGCAAPNQNGKAEYLDRYHNPLISPGTKFAELPPAVQHTIRAEAGSADIIDIVKGSNSNQLVYIIFLANRDIFPPLYVAPDGSVLYPDLTVAMSAPQSIPGPTGRQSITLGDLPPAVIKTIRQLAPDAEIDSIRKESRADQVVYIVTFRGRMRPTLYIASDGTPLREGP